MAADVARVRRDWSFILDVCLFGAGVAQVQHHGHCHVFWSSKTVCCGIAHFRLTQKECHVCLHAEQISNQALPWVEPPHGQELFLTFATLGFFVVSEVSLCTSRSGDGLLLKGGNMFFLPGLSATSSSILGTLLLRPRFAGGVSGGVVKCLFSTEDFNCCCLGVSAAALRGDCRRFCFSLLLPLRGDCRCCCDIRNVNRCAGGCSETRGSPIHLTGLLHLKKRRRGSSGCLGNFVISKLMVTSDLSTTFRRIQ